VILVDTSAWVEYDRATGSVVDQRLTELIATNGSVAGFKLADEERHHSYGHDLVGQTWWLDLAAGTAEGLPTAG
jgi:hypothetical protein